jgi:hypothetical protein
MAGHVSARAADRTAPRRRRLGPAWLAATALASTLGACGGTAANKSSAGKAARLRPASAAAFAWLAQGPAPSTWSALTTPSGEVTLPYPPGWRILHGDAGTVSTALRDSAGRYLGYLNATPRQDGERLRGWPSFRTRHNRAEGDRGVRQIAAAEGLRFIGARGSCVIDDYLSRVASNPYREIACFVAGPRSSSVFIGAALRSDWGKLARSLERAASAFRER